MVRVRFAPSPTGALHIGTLRTAIFNWVFARHHHGKCVLRIEDTDLKRSKPEFEKNILEALQWMGLPYDEGPDMPGDYAPYRQSERMKLGLYQKKMETLLHEGKAYYCFCSDEELEKERRAADLRKVPYVYSQKCFKLSAFDVEKKRNDGIPYTVRFKIQNPTGALIFQDEIRGRIQFERHLLGDFIVMKSDGTPSYNFAAAVDDAEMAITHVIRGEDHISNTPRQLLLFEAFHQKPPLYAHLPMILGSDRSKLSKRHGAKSVMEYYTDGYYAEALFNYLMLLGWSGHEGQEIMTRTEIIQRFSLDRVGKAGAVFDVTKLNWMNGQIIRKLDKNDLFNLLEPYVSSDIRTQCAQYSKAQLKDMVYSVRDNLNYLTDTNRFLEIYAMSFKDFQDKMKGKTWNPEERKVIDVFKEGLRDSDPLQEEGARRLLEKVVAQSGQKKGFVFKTVRFASSGFFSGPSLIAFLVILGKDEISRRLDVSLV